MISKVFCVQFLAKVVTIDSRIKIKVFAPSEFRRIDLLLSGTQHI